MRGPRARKPPQAPWVAARSSSTQQSEDSMRREQQQRFCHRFGFLAILFTGLVLTPPAAHAHVAADGSARATYDFNANWRLFIGDATGAEAVDFNDADWKPVTLPRGWNEDDAFRHSIRDLRTGVAWYRKRFTLPQQDAGKKVFIEF